jgi:hypothetical protein
LVTPFSVPASSARAGVPAEKVIPPKIRRAIANISLRMSFLLTVSSESEAIFHDFF